MRRTLDKKNRWRSLTVGFRMSPEENADLDMRVRLSGLTKQDYIIRRLQCRDVIVQGNPRVYKALRNNLAAVLEELHRIEMVEQIDDALLETIRMITVTIDGLKKEEK